MATVLTIDPLLFGFTMFSDNVMEKIGKGFAVADGNHRVRVKSSAALSGMKGMSDACNNLDLSIRAYPKDELIVLGYSQGAQIAGAWLRKYAASPDAPSPSRLRFILLGNLERGKDYGAKGGGKYADGSPLKDTPNNTQYSVLDIAREGDRYAFPKKGTSLLKAASIHSSYKKVDLVNPEIISRRVVGNTTYVVVP